MTSDRLAGIRGRQDSRRRQAEVANVHAITLGPSHLWSAMQDGDDLLAHVDHLTAENARLRGGVGSLHRPVHFVFSWSSGLRYEEPCPECHGKAGTHPCGCWADEDMRFECLECALGPASGSRRVVLWPCPTATLLNPPTEGETDE